MTKLNIGLVFLLLTLVFSCKKKNDDSVLGLDVQPENDLVGVTITDTASVFMHTLRVDSVKSYNDQYKYLGSTLDPIFGRTDASIYTNFSIANNLTNLSFGTNPVLDSAELMIRYTGQFIGDTTTNLTYDVYLLNESLVSGTAYYSNTELLKSSSTVSHITGKLIPRSDGLYLVLPLEHNMAQYILQTNSNLTNNTAFQSANKGFYITTKNSSNILTATNGAISRFDLDDNLSGVVLYYHDGGSVSSKGQTAQFPFRGVDAIRFNTIKHNYVTGAITNLYNQIYPSTPGDSALGNANIYLNCFGGTRAKVYFPYIKNFSDSQTVSISRAELIVKVDEIVSPYNEKYGYPTNLALLSVSADGTEELVYDQLETTDFIKYGGSYDSGNKQYVFNIARQIQKILSNNLPNHGFYLVNADPSKAQVIRRDNRLNGIVLGGKTNLSNKAIFKITYVKYPYDK
jgi:hypothetical protein